MMQQSLVQPASTADGSLSPHELNLGMQDFSDHYQLADGSAIVGTVAVLFEALQEKVTAFMRAEYLTEEEVACRFIHRLDPADRRWFACLELLKMTDQHLQDAHGRALYQLTAYPAYRYDLKSDISASTLKGDHDPEYFQQVFYVADPTVGTPVALTLGKHVQSVVVPWMRELLRLCQHNDLEGIRGAQIVLESLGSPAAYPEDTDVEWPHTLAFYMRDASGNDCLGPRTGKLVFQNQAADIVNACPTSCTTYHMPALLPL